MNLRHKKKISKALKGNLNAEKWSKKLVISILEQMIEHLKITQKILVSTKTTKTKKGTKTIEKYIYQKPFLKLSLLVEFKIYSKYWFKDMKRKFKQDKDVLNLLDVVSMYCEVNAYNAGAYGTANTKMIKLLLCRHYGWTTKPKRQIEPVREPIQEYKATEPKEREYKANLESLKERKEAV
jgi:hypothetical protein